MDAVNDIVGIKQEDYPPVTSSPQFDCFESLEVHHDVINETTIPQDFSDLNLNIFEKRRGRRAFTFQQAQELEKLFQQNHYISAMELEEISTKLEASPKQIKVWFQNRRVREKSLRNTVDGATDQAANSNGFSQPPRGLINNTIRLNLATKLFNGSSNINYKLRLPMQQKHVRFHVEQAIKPAINKIHATKQETCLGLPLKKQYQAPSEPSFSKDAKAVPSCLIPRDFDDVDSFFNKIKTLRDMGDKNIKIEKVTEPAKLRNIPRPIMASETSECLTLEKFHPYLSYSAEMYAQIHHSKR